METKVNALQWKIGGESGSGIKVTGQMFSRLCIRGGLHIFDYTEYPSLIRGGHNAFQVVVRASDVTAPSRAVDLLVALNQDTIDLHADELSAGAGVMYDPDMPHVRLDALKEQGAQLFPVPLKQLAKDAGGMNLMRNAVALGASVGILNYDLSLLEEVIHVAFDRKGKWMVESNLKAARAGYDYAEEKLSAHFPYILKKRDRVPRMVTTGNTAIGMGAIAAGCKYFAAYPMTPATSILSFLAKSAEKTGMVVRHVADEISAVNSAIGAAYTGVRSMVATSGGGLALMVEGLGLAGMNEVPLVVVDAQRPGPATGLPTWSSQGDLQFVLHAAPDEFPRIIIAPGDVHECYALTAEAFNLAERYQTPVFILTDKFLGESHKSITPFTTEGIVHDRGEIARQPNVDENGLFPRYAVTESGISPRTLPGTPGGIHVANSDEHDVYGAADETVENRNQMMEKRMRKLATAVRDIPVPTLYGPKRADLTVVGWGSTKGPILEALRLCEDAGLSVNFLHFVYLFPLPIAKLTEQLRSCKQTLIIENNSTGQLAQHLKEQVGLLPEGTLRKYDGRPFYPDEIADHIHSMIGKSS